MTRTMLLSLALAFAGCLSPGEAGNLVPRTVAEDSSLPQIEVAGGLFHAEAFGDPAAPLVMVLHGGPGSDYRPLLPLQALAADGYRVVFWDQRGAGLSQRFDKGFYTLDGYLEDLRQVIEHYTVRPGQPLVFIGHSWGAMYLTWFINQHGDYGGRVRGAVLSDPGGFTRKQLDDYLARYNAAFGPTSEPFNDAVWSPQFISADDQARADYLMELIAMRGTPSDGNDPEHPAPSWRSGAVVNLALVALSRQGFDWTTNLRAFAPKVLFLHGDLDTAHTAESQQEMAGAYASSEMVVMHGVGHQQIWERPAEYLAHTRAYFQSIGFEGGAR
jgi:proline iminopeptidase